MALLKSKRSTLYTSTVQSQGLQTRGAQRSGNAVIAALGVVVILAGVAVVSSTNAVSVLQGQDVQLRQAKAVAALEAVLSRRESQLAQLSASGRIAEWEGVPDSAATPPVPANFGLDVIGQARVRWKIEPTRTVRDEDLSLTTKTMKYLQNPSPISNSLTADDRELVNGFTYMYRIVAEAELPGSADAPPALAQGARYVAVTAQPLFRYVINYLRSGPVGDLELSHNPAVTINGNINSNGAIYLGSNVQVNDWGATSGGQGDTIIGSEAKPVIVNAVDGIFRLSKSTIYGGLNKFPMENGPQVAGPESFLTAGGSFPSDIPQTTGAVDFDSQTLLGRVFNPYRITDIADLLNCDFATTGTARRAINGVLLQGVGSDANDSRDDWAGRKKFAAIAQAEFKGYVRTSLFNAVPEIIPQIFKGRALEPQSLIYRETDGDPLTDDHDFAVPEFIIPGSATGKGFGTDAKAAQDATSAAGNGDRLIERSGTYLGYQLGDAAMTRRDPTADTAANTDPTKYPGWDMTTKEGAALPVITVGTNEKVGLIIRERPLPAVNFWPGATDAQKYIPIGDPQALPFFPGKHWRPLVMPFTPIDVAEDLSGSDTNRAWASINHNSSDRTGTTANRSVSYLFGGRLSVVAGAGVPAPRQVNMGADRVQTGPDQSGQGYLSQDALISASWRFIHLQNRNGLTDTKILDLPTGLRCDYWTDDARGGFAPAGTNQGRAWQNENQGSDSNKSLPLQGTPRWSGIVPNLNYSSFTGGPWADGLRAGVVYSEFCSVRWSGYVVPNEEGAHRFSISHDDGFRLWVDDRLVAEKWFYDGIQFKTAPIVLTPKHPAKIVIEMYERRGGDVMQLSWSGPGITGNPIIPESAFRAAPAIGGFKRDSFKAITVRIPLAELSAADDRSKVALMLRPSTQEANMLSGRDRYIALGYSPKRGVFLERRMEDSRTHIRTSFSASWYVGAGSYVSGSDPSKVAANGVLPIEVNKTGTDSKGVGHTVVRTATLQRQAVPPFSPKNNEPTEEFWHEDTSRVAPSSEKINLGDGTTGVIKYGQNTWAGYYKGRKKNTRPYERNITFNLSEAWPVDILGGLGGRRPEITVFADVNTSTTTTTSDWKLAQDTYVPAGNTLTITQIEKPSAYGAEASSELLSAGENASNAIWGPYPAGYSGDDLIEELNNFGTNGWKGRKDWKLGAGGIDSNGNVSKPTAALTLADAGVPNPPNLGDSYDALVHSYALPANNTYWIETNNNPWTSAAGEWLAAQVAPLAVGTEYQRDRPNSDAWIEQLRPWSPLWTTTYLLSPARSRSSGPVYSNLAIPPSTALEEVSSAIASGATTSGLPLILADDITTLAQANIASPTDSIWLRILRSPSDILTFEYTSGTSAEPTSWTTLATPNQAGGVSIADVTGGPLADTIWQSLLAGVAVQSGDVSKPVSVIFSDMSVDLDDGVIDREDWDGASAGLAGSGSPFSRYMASQYQVWFGKQDITEDFFSWADQVGGSPVATEEWFYNAREFWSQNDQWQVWSPQEAFSANNPWGGAAGASRWNPFTGWIPLKNSSSQVIYKDGGENVYEDASNRAMFAKTTTLSLDLARVFTYLTSRTLAQASTLVMGGAASPLAVVGDPRLAAQFNGLIYAARTNRYPFNPNQPLVDPAQDPDTDGGLSGWQGEPSKIGGVNPWSLNVASGNAFPNSFDASLTSPKTASNNADVALRAASGWNISTSWLLHQGIPKLNPYDGFELLPIRTKEFHHGILIRNGSKIDWGIVPGVSSFGAGGTTIVTPNALYVQGDFNNTLQSVQVPKAGGGTESKLKAVPCAVMADSIVLLSNNFNLRSAQQNGMSMSSNNYTKVGALGDPLGQKASATEYVMGIVTHNQPTTQGRVLEGQSSPFIDTMLLMEDWNDKTLKYTGSLVVLDTRRYTDAFLLDGGKSTGRSPLGYLGWVANIPQSRSGPGLTAASAWTGSIGQVYRAPNRQFDFQADFLTAEGTPPFAPFGMTSRGVGGWTRVIQ